MTTFVLSPVDQPVFDPLQLSIIEGLRAAQKTLPASLFYDAHGAALFEQISELPEYYLTRTDEAILHARAAELAALMGPRVALIEPGSGAATKVRPLLAALQAPVAYVPVDVAREQLMDVAAARAREFPSVQILPVWADFSLGLVLPSLPDDARRVVFFPGSTIGNLHPHEAGAFLRSVRALVGNGGGMILGVDRRKNPDALHAAYNDAAGVTAAFNLNMLAHLNREHGGTFDLSLFRHQAFFNDADSRIEMHLESLASQRVQVLGEEFSFAAGETIRSEVSYKYDRPRLEALAAEGGWRVAELFTDPEELFWVAWLVPVGAK
ncbi:MAG: L-histidine N(alpha)-methyltransferase [Gemmatimonadaceae bacterium]|nr:L-histidine N(alpha)-methyltransferase [Gemmatimonadaceae bacterium]